MSDDSVDLVLRFTADRTGHITEIAQQTIEESHRVAAQLDDLDQRVEGLKRRAELADLQAPSPPTRERATTISVSTWDDLVVRATLASQTNSSLIDRSIDSLLTSEVIERIETAHGAVELKSRLDPYDVAAAVTAAVVGTLVDCLVVKIPTGGVWKGEWRSGSLLTFELRSHAGRHDNWLSGLARVPFDRVGGTGIAGMGPRAHRVQTFGHDPLLGLVMGTMDILRGTLTGANPSGVVQSIDVPNAIRAPDLITALTLEVAHLLSDVGTRMGLPLPGWTALMAIPFDGAGSHRPVAEVARWMYLRGYGSWHFLTMSTVPASIEAVIRSYIGMRRLIDEDYERAWNFEANRARSSSISDHPRYRSLSLLAHGVAVLGNVGKIAVGGGNPLAVNYTEWLVFSRKFAQALRPSPPVQDMLGLNDANRVTLDAGWVKLGVDTAVVA